MLVDQLSGCQADPFDDFGRAAATPAVGLLSETEIRTEGGARIRMMDDQSSITVLSKTPHSHKRLVSCWFFLSHTEGVPTVDT